MYFKFSHQWFSHFSIVGIFWDWNTCKKKALPQKIKWRGDWRHNTFFKKGFLFYPWIFQTKQSFTNTNSAKLCYFTQNFKAKNQEPWKFQYNFSLSPLEIPYCFELTQGRSICYLVNDFENFISSTILSPAVLVFFWNSPLVIGQNLAVM